MIYIRYEKRWTNFEFSVSLNVCVNVYKYYLQNLLFYFCLFSKFHFLKIQAPKRVFYQKVILATSTVLYCESEFFWTTNDVVLKKYKNKYFKVKWRSGRRITRSMVDYHKQKLTHPFHGAHPPTYTSPTIPPLLQSSDPDCRGGDVGSNPVSLTMALRVGRARCAI